MRECASALVRETHARRVTGGLPVPLRRAAANFRAPGRVNLIGEHTDYNEGFVMPVAIEFATWVEVRARERIGMLLVHSENYAETCEFDLDDPPSRPWPLERLRSRRRGDAATGGASRLRGANLLHSRARCRSVRD